MAAEHVDTMNIKEIQAENLQAIIIDLGCTSVKMLKGVSFSVQKRGVSTIEISINIFL